MNPGAGQPLSRGKFLKLCTRIILSLAGLLGLGGLVRFFSHKPDPGSSKTYTLGLADDFPLSGKLIRPDIPAVIYKTDQGFQVYSLICTHLGCTLEESGNGFSCPCHGSEFDPVGKVVRGPAQDDLPTLELEITEGGELLVHTGGGIL